MVRSRSTAGAAEVSCRDVSQSVMGLSIEGVGGFGPRAYERHKIFFDPQEKSPCMEALSANTLVLVNGVCLATI